MLIAFLRWHRGASVLMLTCQRLVTESSGHLPPGRISTTLTGYPLRNELGYECRREGAFSGLAGAF